MINLIKTFFTQEPKTNTIADSIEIIEIQAGDWWA